MALQYFPGQRCYCIDDSTICQGWDCLNIPEYNPYDDTEPFYGEDKYNDYAEI